MTQDRATPGGNGETEGGQRCEVETYRAIFAHGYTDTYIDTSTATRTLKTLTRTHKHMNPQEECAGTHWL